MHYWDNRKVDQLVRCVVNVKVLNATMRWIMIFNASHNEFFNVKIQYVWTECRRWKFKLTSVFVFITYTVANIYVFVSIQQLIHNMQTK
jgi:hypothetical protein